MTIKFRISHMTKFIRSKTDEYGHYDDQTLKTRVSHMINDIS